MSFREFHYRWQWNLQSSPETLWPLVTDTNRFNRDSGVPECRTARGFDGVTVETEVATREIRYSHRVGRRAVRMDPSVTIRGRASLCERTGRHDARARRADPFERRAVPHSSTRSGHSREMRWGCSPFLPRLARSAPDASIERFDATTGSRLLLARRLPPLPAFGLLQADTNGSRRSPIVSWRTAPTPLLFPD